MCPRVCAFGPRTSPTTRSSAPSSAWSQLTSTIAGSSDTLEKLLQDRVELAGPFEVHEMPGSLDLMDVELEELSGGDERLVLADDELQRSTFVVVASDVRRIGAVTDCLDCT